MYIFSCGSTNTSTKKTRICLWICEVTKKKTYTHTHALIHAYQKSWIRRCCCFGVCVNTHTHTHTLTYILTYCTCCVCLWPCLCMCVCSSSREREWLWERGRERKRQSLSLVRCVAFIFCPEYLFIYCFFFFNNFRIVKSFFFIVQRKFGKRCVRVRVCVARVGSISRTRGRTATKTTRITTAKIKSTTFIGPSSSSRHFEEVCIEMCVCVCVRVCLCLCVCAFVQFKNSY